MPARPHMHVQQKSSSCNPDFFIAELNQWILLFKQEEVATSSGQVEPPGMHMIYLPYSDDIRPVEEASFSSFFSVFI